MRPLTGSAIFLVSLCCAPALADAEAEGSFSFGPPLMSHAERIAGASAHYSVEMGGYLDMDNTMTRMHGTRTIAFQNNISLTIANTGDTPVVNPRVVVNGRGRWGALEEVLEEFTRGARHDQDKIYLIWECMRRNMHHDAPLFNSDFHDPVRMLNIYGGGLCDDAGLCGSALYCHLGFSAERGGEDPFTRCLHGHMQCEVFYDGDFQFMDIDQDVFFLDRENRKPVSGDALARDHDLAKRELAYGPVISDWVTAQRNASLFGIDDDRTGYGLTGHRMDYTLRPGERIVFRWDNVGKYSWERSEGPHRYYGNSKIVYAPRLDAADSVVGYAGGGGGWTCNATTASLVVRTDTCYTICGGSVSAEFAGGGEDAGFEIASSIDGDDYTTVWEAGGPGPHAAAAVLDGVLGLKESPPRREHYVRFTALNGVGSTLSDVRVATDITASPMALPRLCVGTNQVEYADATAGPHEVTVTHEWVECADVTPPEPPRQPISPKPGEVVGRTFIEFRWPALLACDAYWIRVSRRPDMLYPYRPNYDVIVAANEHTIPKRGMFSPNETYYWRVRPRSCSGVWGEWSPVWTFEWNGPMAPRNVAHHVEDGAIALAWEPNPRGTRPVHYDVYGSDERGFSVSEDAYEVFGLGRVPGNLLGSTANTGTLAVSPKPLWPAMNKAYYRVVAVDANGIESCPSDFAEMPRPYVFTRPVTVATAGEEYRYRMDTIRSIGDLQSRYIEPRHAYWEKETYQFTLESGPEWLRLDECTGLLSGTPAVSDTGEAAVEVRVLALYPDEVSLVSKSGPAFQKRRMLPESERECRHRFAIAVGAE